MGRGGGRGPKQLRFRALLEAFGEAIDLITDSRRQASVLFSLRDCYLSSWAMFFLQDPSLLEFQRRFEDQLQSNNLRTVFGVQKIPSDSQLRDVVDQLEWQPLRAAFREYVRRLQRSKVLERYQVLGGRYLLTLDGSEYFNSERLHCPGCLERHHGDGTVEYYHQILQPTIVAPGLPQVLPLAPEFIRRQDGANKQDCETNAAKRAIKRIRREYRQLDLVIVGDGLYSTGPFIRDLEKQRLSFLLGAKPADHKSQAVDFPYV